jgi:Tfp pilus assembly protein PilX
MNDMTSRTVTRDERGSSMVLVLLVLFAILTLGVAGLSSAGFGITLSNNYRTGAQAEQAAESGLIHTVHALNNTGGVTSFLTDVANTTSWNALMGTSALSMPGYSNIQYTVNYLSNPAPTHANIWISSTGQAPGQSQRTINERLGALPPYSCGAIDLVNTGVSASFQGTSFSVDGNDYAVGATTPTAGSTPTLGISTRSQTDANTVATALNAGGQQNNVTGTPVTGQVASVGPCTGVSDSRLTNRIVPTILSQPSPPVVSLAGGNVNGNVTLGTVAAPEITYYSGDTTIKGNGNASGAGILIVNGGLTIQGTLDFTGLVIVLGSTQITTVTGNASVYGALWTTDLSLSVGGSAAVRYSSPSLALANSIPGVMQPLLPQKVQVLAWSQG